MGTLRMPQLFKDIVEKKHHKTDAGEFWAWLCKRQNGTAKNLTKTKDSDKLEKTIATSLQAYREFNKSATAKGKGSGKTSNANAKGKGKGKGKGKHAQHKNFAEVHLPQLGAFQYENGETVHRLHPDVLHKHSKGLCVGSVRTVGPLILMFKGEMAPNSLACLINCSMADLTNDERGVKITYPYNCMEVEIPVQDNPGDVPRTQVAVFIDMLLK